MPKGKKRPKGTKPSRETGRPALLTDTLIAQAEILARLMLPEKSIAHLLGISPRTLRLWKQHAKEGKSKAKALLLTALEKGRAQGEREALDVIKAHAPKQWTAAAWLLERRNPAEYAKRDRVDNKHSGVVKYRVSFEGGIAPVALKTPPKAVKDKPGGEASEDKR